MPGLTAEASLYRTSKQYSTLSPGFAGTVPHAAIVPAYLPSPETQTARSGHPHTVAEADAISVGLPTLLHGDGGSHGSAFQWGPSASPGADTGSITAASVPAHRPNIDEFKCDLCIVGAYAAWAVCTGQATVSAGYCGIFYPLCLAAEWAICDIIFLTGMADTCHAFGTPGFTPGLPCCPVECDVSCCGSGEGCAGLIDPHNAHSGRLCCSTGYTPCDQICCDASETCCGGKNCCTAGETCMPDGSCCPTTNVCGGKNCCTAGETCMPDGSCCPTANVCGKNGDCCTSDETCMPQGYCCPNADVCGETCCSPGDTCMPDGSCCPAGHKVCGGTCCPSANDVCDPNTNTCTQTCPDGTPPCGGECCAAGAACCNGNCCAAGQLCCNVQTPQGFQPQCVTPGADRDGHTWCGSSSGNASNCPNCVGNMIDCGNCTPSQPQCLTICQHGRCSVDWYCQ
jgi:hypothetical protein